MGLDALAQVPRAKLRPASSAAGMVVRQRLLAQLDDGVSSSPVMLVVGPAGSGKTSLLVTWADHAAQGGRRFSWLALDETDQDATQLWRGVLASLQQSLPGVGGEAAEVLEQGGSPLAAVDALLSELAAPQQPMILVIDDLHFVDEAAGVAQSLSLLLEHLPGWLHLVISSRRTPPLPVARMEARGQLRVLRYAHLRFSPEESRELLAQMAPDLAPGQVERAAARADGWAASLRLATLTDHGRTGTSNPSAGSHTGQLVAEYVWQEVFAAEDPELVEVLVQTSVATRVNADLGERLTGHGGVGAMLTKAVERGLFVSRVGTRGWFEVHPLVREVLAAELLNRSLVRYGEQHAVAAEWFAEHQQISMALEHWLIAGKPREALRLLADSAANLYDDAREATLSHVIEQIPGEVANIDLDAVIEYAWCHVLVDRRRFWELTARASQRATSVETVPGEVVGRIQTLEAIEAATRGDLGRCAQRSREAATSFGDTWWSDLLGRFGWNMIAREIALSERWVDPGPEVDEVRIALSLDKARSTAFEGTCALGEALAGHPDRALTVAAELRHRGGVEDRTILRSEVRLAEAIAHRERGERSIAIRAFLELIDQPVGPVLYARLLALLELTRLRLDEGDLDTAERMFDEATDLVATEMPGPDSRSWLARTGTQLALRAGRLEVANGWADKITDPLWAAVSRARVSLAEGDLSNAEHALQGATPRCVRHDVILGLLRYRLSAESNSSEVAATAHLLSAAQSAVAQGLVQTVASEGDLVVGGLGQLAWQLPDHWLHRVRRGAQVQPYASVASRLAHLIDPLTARELEILRLLPTRLTLREIAERLSISPNTLKTHLRAIYRKLECGSRLEAADIARSLNRESRDG